MSGIADDCAVWGHVGDDHAVGTDLRPVADRDWPEQLRARADRDVVLHGWVALARREARPAQGHALIQGHVVPDLGRLADHDPCAMVDEQPLADARRRVDLDARQRAADHRDRSGQKRNAGARRQ